MLKSLLNAPLTTGEKIQCVLETGWTALFQSQRILTSPTVPASGKRLCVFAHFDVLNQVDPHVLHHLRALKALGFDIVFVSTCQKMKEPDRNELLAICHKLILRNNSGYDFGSYRSGLRAMAYSHDYDQILLANDSVYGPFYDLQTIFDDLAKRDIDIWSITDSYEHEYHLQSYFLVLNRKAWLHPQIQRFWKNFWHVNLKEAAIHLYEIGLSHAAKKARLRLDSWCDTAKIIESVLKKANAQISSSTKDNPSFDEIEKRRLNQLLDVSLGSNCNITHYYWDYLIREYRCPYLKVELIRDNPARVPNVHFYRDYLNGSYPVELIHQHLQHYAR